MQQVHAQAEKGYMYVCPPMSPAQGDLDAVHTDLRTALDSAHGVSVRLEKLGVRLFGAQPSSIGEAKSGAPQAMDPPAILRLQNVTSYLSNAISELHAHLDRLERL